MNDNWSMKLDGADGTVELLKDRIVITRPGTWNAIKYKGNGKREIPYSGVSEVLFKEARSLTFGEIEFNRVGTAENEKHFYRVKFKKDQQLQFEKLKEKTFEIINFYARQK